MRPREDLRTSCQASSARSTAPVWTRATWLSRAADGRQQDLVIDRLDQIIVRAGLLAHQHVVSIGQRRQEDERHVRQGRPARASP